MTHFPATVPILEPRTGAGESMLRNLLANLDGMAYRCVIDAHWTLEFLSHGCHTLTGYQIDELLFNRTISYQEVTHPDDRQRVDQMIADALAIEQPFSLEYRIIRKDGGIRWVWERGIGARNAAGAYIAIEGLIQDVTQRKEAELALHEAERRFRSMFENAVEGVFQSTIERVYLAVNPAMAVIFGFDSPAEMIELLRTRPNSVYVDPSRTTEFFRLMAQSGSVTNFESRIYQRNGNVIDISENVRAVRDADGQLLFFEGSVVDITERKSHEEQIRFQATHDALTGLPNRNLLHDRMKQALINSQRTGDLTAVAFVDLDRFKLINDSLGHQTGDDLLKLIADRLQHCLRGGDTVARHGGDEFVVLLPHQKNLLTITDTVERMLAAVCKPWHVSGRILEITCSIGISIFPHDAEEADALLQHADSAMYKAKELGRNRYKYFAAEMNTNARHRLDLLHSLRAAIPNNEFTLHYQPKIHLASGTMVGAEALIRWNSPTRGIVSPMDFIPFAEENGLINLIGEWVLHTACTQAVAWQQAGYQTITVSVNLSPHQLARDDIVTIVDRTLRQSGLQARYLELEITETAVMGDVEKSLLMLQALKNLGVKISIDDFGTGYSSLYYLKRFPVDNLKIDRSFVTEITTEHQDAAIVTAIISLAHILHLNVIAEGVENDAQRQFLIDSGCDEGQGYFFSRPMPDHSFAQLLQRV